MRYIKHGGKYIKHTGPISGGRLDNALIDFY